MGRYTLKLLAALQGELSRREAEQRINALLDDMYVNQADLQLKTGADDLRGSSQTWFPPSLTKSNDVKNGSVDPDSTKKEKKVANYNSQHYNHKTWQHRQTSINQEESNRKKKSLELEMQKSLNTHTLLERHSKTITTSLNQSNISGCNAIVSSPSRNLKSIVTCNKQSSDACRSTSIVGSGNYKKVLFVVEQN